jgi:hypothetical protein
MANMMPVRMSNENVEIVRAVPDKIWQETVMYNHIAHAS